MDIIHLSETTSTNLWLQEHQSQTADSGMTVCWADYQTAGRGCGSNRWESERGKNLLFSVRFRPEGIAAERQFTISMATPLAIIDELDDMGISDISIKWPNDIYWKDRKLAGMRIDNKLRGHDISDCIIGIGLNVNQEKFVSDAPNPVSLCHILGREVARKPLLERLLSRIETALKPDASLPLRYNNRLYRRVGFHAYRDQDGDFEAETAGVEPDGTLVLRDRKGTLRRYAFKEVSFVISNQ
ncbi:MAG: biotin--[Prevotella sp.]|nr:biotin--[acetyl-CoA-carboxylase] ligase [Prevotella sp.]